MAARRRAAQIDVLVDSATCWKDKPDTGCKAIVRRAVTALPPPRCQQARRELAIVLTDDSAIRLLNRQWRGIDAATNVLSFPAKARRPAQRQPLLGDIVLAYETIAREARAEGKPFAHHLAHLAVHGFLHLVGYDHERDEEPRRWNRPSATSCARLAIPDPYRPTRPDQASLTRANGLASRDRRPPQSLPQER